MKNIAQKKKKIKVKNTVPHLLSAVCNHDDCPSWLRSLIWNALSDNACIPADTPGFYKQCLKYSLLSDDSEIETYGGLQ